MSDPQPALAAFRPDPTTSAIGAVLLMVSIGVVSLARPVTAAYGAGSGAQFHEHNPYGGGNDGGGGIGGRCSSKLDATLQQMFRKISGSSGGGGRSAYFPPFQLDDDDDDHHPADSPFSRPRPLVAAAKSRRRSLRLNDDHRYHQNDVVDAAAAAITHQQSDAADAEAAQSTLLAHLARLQRRHQRHTRFHSAGGAAAFDPYDLRADANDDDARRGTAAHRVGAAPHHHRIHVAELRVRVPNAADAPASAQSYGGGGGAWVRVDRCQFQAANRTLDTRLTFPDLTISGRVQLQPPAARSDNSDPKRRQSGEGGGGGGCTMILRLRQAGIEFRTVPLRQAQPLQQPLQQQQRSRRQAPSVRTDSYFAQPGFVSVFAHGCDALLADAAAAGGGGGGSMNGRRRRNRYRWQHGGGGGGRDEEQRREGDDFASNNAFAYDDADPAATRPSDDLLDDAADAFADEGGDGDGGDDDDGYMNYGPADDYMRFSGDILGYAGSGYESRGRTWQNVELANSAERDEQRTRDLEGMFARGVRGLLTSYMQRALQPAIKETLMESLGYRLSYG